MSIFQVGDKVKLKDSSQNIFPILRGRILTITYSNDGVVGFVSFDSQYWASLHFDYVHGCFVLGEISE